MAAEPTKKQIMVEIGDLLDECKMCPKNEKYDSEVEREAHCGGCDVYERLKELRPTIGGGSREEKNRVAALKNLTVDLYRQHKADEWTDKKIREKYGLHNAGLVAWKKKNFTQEEIREMSLLRKSAPKNLPDPPHNKKKDSEVKALELAIEDLKEKLKIAEEEKETIKENHKHAIDEYVAEKELAYQAAKEWEEKYKAECEEHKLTKWALGEFEKKQETTERLYCDALERIEELEKQTTPMRELLKVVL